MKTSLRMCCVCRQMKGKDELVRVVKNKNGEIFVDETGKRDGRGAYICRDRDCLSKLKKTRGLSRAFKCQIGEEIYEKLLENKEI